MSEMNNLNENPVVEQETKSPETSENVDAAPLVVNHVMYPESVITETLTIMSGMTVTGADNIIKFADVYRTLAAGQVVPVTMG